MYPDDLDDDLDDEIEEPALADTQHEGEVMTPDGFGRLFRNGDPTESAPVHQTYYALLNVSPTVPRSFFFSE